MSDQKESNEVSDVENRKPSHVGLSALLGETAVCCEIWPKICGAFDWYAFVEQPTLYSMPHIQSDGSSFRVNHCPSCGSVVRDCIIASERIDDSRAMFPLVRR